MKLGKNLFASVAVSAIFLTFLATAFADTSSALTTVFAKSTQGRKLNRNYGPENDTSVITNHPQVKRSLRSKHSIQHLWTTNFELRPSFTIPYDIVLGNGYHTISFHSRNYQNMNYHIILLRCIGLVWIVVGSKLIRGNDPTFDYFTDLNPNATYRISISSTKRTYEPDEIQGRISFYKY